MQPTDQLTAEQRVLVEKNVPLARSLAMSVWIRNRHELEGAEVVAIAFQGLVTAARRYNPSMSTPETVANGKAFAGFARIYINGAILEWQRSRDHVPKRQRRMYKELQQAGWGEGKKVHDLSEATGLPEDKVREIIHSVEATAVSLDIPNEYGEESYTGNQPIYSRHDVDSAILETSVKDAFYRCFVAMPFEWQVVWALRVLEDREFPAIAAELEMRQNYVRQIYQEAVEELHRAVVQEAS